jgi:hypothetical protein
MSEQATQVHRVVLDGIEQHDRSIQLVDDGKEHPSVVEIGDLPTAVRLTPDRAGT